MRDYSEISITSVGFDRIKPNISRYITENDITVDSFWEDHIINANHYAIEAGGEIIGFFAIYKENELWVFYVAPEYSKYSQALFARARQYEQVTCAFVPTGDELFLSHCVDNCVKIEKQAYFTRYINDAEPRRQITLRQADFGKDDEQLKLWESDYEDLKERTVKQAGCAAYIAEENGEHVGFGVIEFGRVAENIGSIGMFVLKEHRKGGVGQSILRGLRGIVEASGREARSGCWYYNHNSKKSQEAAGAACKTRLLKISF